MTSSNDSRPAAHVRRARPSDSKAIFEVTKIAFQDHPYSEGKEQYLCEGLLGANALTLSLVAEVDGEVVGHVAFSPVTIADGSAGWFGMGPLSVSPEFQRQGIGSSLVREGLSMMEAIGARGCVVLGDPAYYRRFGFRNDLRLTLEGVAAEHFQAIYFAEGEAAGDVKFHPAFYAEYRGLASD